MKTFTIHWLAGLILAPVLANAAWPVIAAPAGARTETIGQQVRLNGIPMHMQRVLSSKSPGELLDFYRTELGERRAEQVLPGSYIFSQERGDHFITIRIKPLSPKLTEVLVSSSDMLEAKRAANRPLGIVLPADSVVLSDMESVDGGKRSRQLVVSNSHALESNVQQMTRELSARGYQPDGERAQPNQSSYVQLFKGEQREAQLTVVRKANTTNMVLTTILSP